MEPGIPGGLSYQPGYETTAEKIAEYIVTSGLQPGDRLPTELSLSELLGVSRATIREAVKLLSARGMVRTRRGSGIYVVNTSYPQAQATIDLSMPVDPEHIMALFEFRCLQEMLTARLAAERITPSELRALEETVALNRRGAETEQWELFIESDVAFHQGIANATHNQFLAETVATTFRLQRWAIKLVTGGAPGSLMNSARQHAAILAAMKQGKPEEAANAMRTHVQTVITEYQAEVRRLLSAQTNNVVSLQ